MVKKNKIILLMCVTLIMCLTIFSLSVLANNLTNREVPIGYGTPSLWDLYQEYKVK